ncbi:MAG: domain S-box [Pedosphaera sp.]|nr:domain S-box [Pedosphaera sp.]
MRQNCLKSRKRECFLGMLLLWAQAVQGSVASDSVLEPAGVGAMAQNFSVQQWVIAAMAVCLTGLVWWNALLRKQAGRRAEKALREKEEFVRNIIDTDPNLIFVKDREGRFVLLNRAAAERFQGAQPEKVVGKLETETPLKREELSQFHRDDLEVMDTLKEKFIAEEMLTDHEGKTFWFQTVKRALISPDGKANHVLGVATNITERKRAEKVQDATYRISQAIHTTHRLEELYRVIHSVLSELMPANNFYIALHDVVTDKLSFPYFVDEHDVRGDIEERYGSNPDHPLRKRRRGLTEYVLRTGDVVHAPRKVVEELIEGGEVMPVGVPHVDWLGVPLKIEERTIGVMALQSYSENIYFSQRDVEILKFVSGQVAIAIERKQAENRIREQATLLDLAHDAIFVRDLDGRIEFWNKGAERLYGWTAGEAVGQTIGQLFSGDDKAHIKIAQRIVLEKGEWVGQVEKLSKDGRKVIADSRWTLLRNEAGKPRSVLVINTDVTEEKRLEAQFLRSQRIEGIGTLATGMAHDLNNILAPILMSAGTLRCELTERDRELAITRIEMSVKRGAEIIQQVLTFGRGVSGDRVAVNPAELMEEMTRIIGQTFPKDITITLTASEDLWPMLGDRTQIHQVLLNLCVNARDAMAKGGRLSLAAENIVVDEHYPVLHARARPGRYVLLKVTDTGCGIPLTHRERIFDPFFTTKEFGKGTGLGLSTVLGIVKSHHGLVGVESEMNRGTTFKVLFPAKPDAAANSAKMRSNPAAGNGETQPGGDEKMPPAGWRGMALEKRK